MGLLLIAGLGYLEYTGIGTPAISRAYVVPVALVTWLAGRGDGILMAVTAAIVGLSVQLLATDDKQLPELLGDTAMRGVSYIIAAYFVSRIKILATGAGLQANHDQRAGLSSRREFLDKAQTVIARSGVRQYPVTIIYLDIDNFKRVNQRLGYVAANTFLRWVAETIIRQMRGAYLLTRLDGDEFAVLLPSTGPDSAREIVEHLREALAQHPGHAEAPVTFTIGVVTYRRQPHSVREVIRTAQNLVCWLKQDRINAVSYQVVGD